MPHGFPKVSLGSGFFFPSKMRNLGNENLENLQLKKAFFPLKLKMGNYERCIDGKIDMLESADWPKNRGS